VQRVVRLLWKRGVRPYGQRLVGFKGKGVVGFKGGEVVGFKGRGVVGSKSEGEVEFMEFSGKAGTEAATSAMNLRDDRKIVTEVT
jgi:hypothetical protein